MVEKLQNFWHIDIFMKSAKAVVDLSSIVEKKLKEWKETQKFSRFFFTHYIDENKKDYHIKIGVEEADENKVKEEIKKLEAEIKIKLPSDFNRIGDIQDVEITDFGTGIPVDYIVCESYNFYYLLKNKSKFQFNPKNLAIVLERFIHHFSNDLLLPPEGELWTIVKVLDYKVGTDKY